VGAEVGSWRGDSAARFLRWVRPECLFLIDPWRHTADPRYRHAYYAGEEGQPEVDRVYAAVLARFKDEIAQGRVVIRRESSLDAAARWSNGDLDWAYIDGDHMYDAVLADLEAYWSLLKPGGLLTGDDYGRLGWWDDGVTKAVKEFCGARSCVATIMGSQFVIKKPYA
jgi:hypothetical protein